MHRSPVVDRDRLRGGGVRNSVRRGAVAGRLEGLSPFWTAYAMTLTATVGGGMLALPIALAGIGPLPALVVLVVLGAVNVLTIVFLCEAVGRSGVVRNRDGYLGRMVQEYLGPAGAALLTASVAVGSFVSLQAFYIAFATTLADTTGLPAPVWAALVFAVGVWLLRRPTLALTAGAALLIGVATIVLTALIALVALIHLHPAHLGHVRVPFLHGEPFEPTLLQTVFGVVFLSYAGHTAIANCGRTVLARDPSGRSLLWGGIAGMGTVVLLYCLWVVAVQGAVAPETLARESGTALIPLAAEVGPIVRVLGTGFVVLSAGMATIHCALNLFNLVRERLPVSLVAAPRTRVLVQLSPVAVAFALAEWGLISGTGSFTGALGFIGVVSVPLATGICPVLAVAVSRTRGTCRPEALCSSRVQAWGRPAVLAAVYLLALAGMVLHGLFIWQNPAARMWALATAVVVVLVTGRVWRGGAFRVRSEGAPSAALSPPAESYTTTQ